MTQEETTTGLARNNPKSKWYCVCHSFIRRKYGKASKCENPECKSISPKRFEWALKKGRNYSKDINDYWQLCPSCHRVYDMTESQKRAMSKASHKIRPFIQGVKNVKSISIVQMSLEGETIKVWPSICRCCVELGLHKQGILNCLSGKMNQTKGFKFKVYNSQN